MQLKLFFLFGSFLINFLLRELFWLFLSIILMKLFFAITFLFNRILLNLINKIDWRPSIDSFHQEVIQTNLINSILNLPWNFYWTNNWWFSFTGYNHERLNSWNYHCITHIFKFTNSIHTDYCQLSVTPQKHKADGQRERDSNSKSIY